MSTSTTARKQAGGSQNTRQDDFVAVPYLRHGQLISLIRWTMVSGEWTYTTMLAEYLHRDEGSWHVIVGGKRAKLSRSEWAIFN